MPSLMVLLVAFRDEAFIAKLAFERLITCVSGSMQSHQASVSERLVTALERADHLVYLIFVHFFIRDFKLEVLLYFL